MQHARQAPPTTPGDLVRRRQSVWPLPLGVIGVVLASFYLLGAIWGIVGWFLQGAFTFGMNDQMIDIYEQQRGFMPLSIALSAASALVAALLLVGSIDLLRRRARARPRLMVWSVAKIVLALIMTGVTVMMQRAMIEAVAKDPSAAPMPGFVGSYMSVVVVVFMLMLALPPPIFALIWFTRPRFKQEMADWR